jgi:hypothetical protein
MKRFFNYIIIAIVAISTLSLGGCATQNKLDKGVKQEKCVKQKKQKKQKKEKIKFISLDKVKGNFKEGIRLIVTVENNTIFNLRVTSAEAHILHKGRKFGRITVNSEIKLPRRSRTQVEIPLRETIANNVATLSALNNLRKGVFSGWTLAAKIDVATGISKHSFEENNISLEDLIKQIDLGKLLKSTNLSKLADVNVKEIFNQIFK